MKSFCLLLVFVLSASLTSGQTDSEPCCAVIAVNTTKGVVLARNFTTGQLFEINLPATEIKSFGLGTMLSANNNMQKVTALNGKPVSHATIRRYSGATDSKTSVKNTEPVGVATMKMHPEEPCCNIIDLVVDPAEPVNGITQVRVNNAEPVGMQVNNAEPVGIVTVRNKVTGETMRIYVPKKVIKGINVGDPAYSEPVNGLVVIQAQAAGELLSYGFYATSEKSNDKPWVIKKLNNKTGSGKILAELPSGTEFDVTIYTAGTGKVLSNTMMQKTFVLLPGSYDVEINKIKLEGVPVEKGNDTRIKTGILHITNPTTWTLYDESGQKVLINATSKQKRGLPVGKYKLALMGQNQIIEIKDGETIEF